MPLSTMLLSVLLIALIAAKATSADSSVIDLSTWQQFGEPVWQFDDNGVSAGPSESAGFLVSTVKYGDFHLTVEFWVEDDKNSGIFIRCNDASQVEGVTSDDCYEVIIWDNGPNQDFRTGSIIKHIAPAAHIDSIGRWNEYDMVVSGSSITVVLNGVETAWLTDDLLGAGEIAIQ